MCPIEGMPIYGMVIARENLAAALSLSALFLWLVFLRGAVPGRPAVMAGSRGSSLLAPGPQLAASGKPGGRKRPVPRPVAAFVGVFHLVSFRRRASKRTLPALVVLLLE
jgi:hypothetical protein